jgi:hypothetical protein
LGLPVGVPVWVDEFPSIQLKALECSTHSPTADLNVRLLELKGDSGGRPLVLAPQPLNQGNHVAVDRSRLPNWCG